MLSSQRRLTDLLSLAHSGSNTVMSWSRIHFSSDNYTVVARTEHDEEVLWSMRRKLVSDNQLLSQINGVSGFATVYDILEVNDTFYVSFQKVDAPLHQYLDGPISFWTYRTFLQAVRPFIAAFNYLEKHQLPIGSIGTSDVVVDHGQFLLLGISQHGFTKDVPDRGRL